MGSHGSTVSFGVWGDGLSVCGGGTWESSMGHMWKQGSAEASKAQ